MPRSAPLLLRWLLLSALALLVYAPALGGEFLWDDTDWIVGNEALHGWDGLARIWFEPGAVIQYYPLTYTSWWLDVQLFGLDPFAMHVENVLLHALVAALLGQVLRKLELPGADAASLLFLLHPVHVESVAWLTERKNVLSGACYLGALLAWVEHLADGRKRSLWLALVLFALALLAKTATLVLPAVLLLIAWWRGPGTPSARIRGMAPFFALAVVAALSTVLMERREGAVGHDWSLGWAERLAVAGQVPWFYLGKLSWPQSLAFVYPRWDLDPVWGMGLGTPASLVPLGLWLALLAALWRRRAGPSRHVLLALGTFWIALLPVSGLIDFYFMRYAFVADHFQYLASLGVIALAAGAGAHWARNVPSGWLRVVPLALVALPLAWASWNQAGLYRDLETLWRGTLARNEQAWMPHTNLGNLLAERGESAEALAHHRRALEVYPDAFESLNFVGGELARQAAESGDEAQAAEALALLERARAVKPEDPLTDKNLGVLWLGRGDEARAIEAFERGLALDPDNLNLQCNLARVLAGAEDRTLRDGPRAVRLAEAATADPANRGAELLWLLTGAYATAGRLEDARRTALATLEAARAEGHAELTDRAQQLLQRLP